MTVATPATLTIPPLIRRNTILLALAQAFTGAGTGLMYSIGPLIIVSVSGSTALAGLSVTVMGLSRFLVAYPIGRVTDAYGRKPAMLAGLACGLVAAILVGSATLWGIFPLLLLSMLAFGMAMNAAQQLRVAATDMYPASRRAEGLGYVLTGSLVGVVVGPILVTIAEVTAPGLGVDALGLPWLLLPLVIVPGMLLVTQVRPDPKKIAERLGDYYPGYRPEPGAAATKGEGVSLGAFLRHYPRRIAVFTNVAAQGNMAVVMVSSSLLLHQHGSSLPEIAVASGLHSIGMWAFSIPLGRMADRFGRRQVLLLGGVVATAGAVLATQSTGYGLITLGAFLVGVGWCGANVATTVMIADTTQPAERGRGVGLNDSLTAGANILVPLIAGPLSAVFGVPSTGLLAAVIMLPPLALLLLTVRETRPGVYDSTSEGDEARAPSSLPEQQQAA